MLEMRPGAVRGTIEESTLRGESMKAVGRYDGNLQMFVEEAREPARTRLAFLRWLGEQGLLEHEVFGPPSGPFVEAYAARQVAELPVAS